MDRYANQGIRTARNQVSNGKGGSRPLWAETEAGNLSKPTMAEGKENDVLRAALDRALDSGQRVTLYLLNGVRLRGVIERHDTEGVAFRDTGGKQLIIRLPAVASLELSTRNGKV